MSTTPERKRRLDCSALANIDSIRLLNQFGLEEFQYVHYLLLLKSRINYSTQTAS